MGPVEILWSSEWSRRLYEVVAGQARDEGRSQILTRDFVAAVCGGDLAMESVVRLVGLERRALRELAGFPEPFTDDIDGFSFNAVGVIEEMWQEAQRLRQSIGPAHLLVGLASAHVAFGRWGVFTNDIRRSLDFAVPAAESPPGLDTSPPLYGPVVLGNHPRIVELLRNDYAPTLGVIHAAAPWGKAGSRPYEWEAMTWGRRVDIGLYDREDAFKAQVCKAIESVNIIKIEGGQTRRVVSALASTPALACLAAASQRGAVIWGVSAGAAALGERAYDVTCDDGPATIRCLGCLPFSIVPHHFDNALGRERALKVGFDDNAELLLVHEGAAATIRNRHDLVATTPGVDEATPRWWNSRSDL